MKSSSKENLLFYLQKRLKCINSNTIAIFRTPNLKFSSGESTVRNWSVVTQTLLFFSVLTPNQKKVHFSARNKRVSEKEKPRLHKSPLLYFILSDSDWKREREQNNRAVQKWRKYTDCALKKSQNGGWVFHHRSYCLVYYWLGLDNFCFTLFIDW